MGRDREIQRLIVERLKAQLVPSVARKVVNAASKELAEAQATDLPLVVLLWLGWTPASPPEEGQHIKANGPMRFLLTAYAASGTDPADAGVASDVLEAIEDALIDYEVVYAAGKPGALLYLISTQPESVRGMTVALSAEYGAHVTKT